MIVRCKECYHKIEATEEFYGEDVECPKCSSGVYIPFPETTPEPQIKPAGTDRLTVSTGRPCYQYEIIDTVFALDSNTETLFSGADPSKAFQGVKAQLKQIGKDMRADAIIDCHFEYRSAVDKGLLSDSHCIEIFAYGTAVRKT
ncbi:MAG: YbjQ family protein [Lentisphaeraceae bacterium]|nr:YbjQ family protein [Lentisphaeraceae bacterium]